MIPTSQSYDSMAVAYRFFNERLFGGQLPEVLLSYQRGPHMGFAARRRWISVADRSHRAHELAMHPGYFAGSPIEEVLGTLIHECCHIYQYENGKAGRGGYHNKEFTRIMAARGLICSNTASPGGKQIGDKMSHYILWDGPAWRAIRELIDKHDFTIPWLDVVAEARYVPLQLFDDEGRRRDRTGEILEPPLEIGTELDTPTNGPAAAAPFEVQIDDGEISSPISIRILDFDEAEPIPAPLTDSGGGLGDTTVAPISPDDVTADTLGAGLEDELILKERVKRKRKRASKTTYTCPKEGCSTKVWAKPGVQVGCFCENNGGQFAPDSDAGS